MKKETNFFKLLTGLILGLILNMTSSFGQSTYSDLKAAFEMCHLGEYYFNNCGHKGQIVDVLNLPNNKLKETHATWVKFSVEQSGSLEFIIIPDELDDDIDFVLYELGKNNDLSPLRVMTSGETIGLNSFDCLGQTGLKATSKDIEETEGCYDLDDNYLSPVTLTAGQSYVLFINNFHDNGRGFSLLMEGDGDLKFKGNCDDSSDEWDFNLYPIPSSDFLNISTDFNLDQELSLEVFNLVGKRLHHEKIDQMEQVHSLDISNYISGQYILRIQSNQIVKVKSFIKQ